MVVRWFLIAEAVVFGAAALMHDGVLLHGYEHARARNAESVIALVLAAGLLWTVFVPTQARGAGLASQSFALVGTMVGLFMIAIGVGPRTPLDLILHATMIALLVAGLIVARSVHAIA